MKLFEALLRHKSSPQTLIEDFSDSVDEGPDEEYQLPEFHYRPFVMTEELERRRLIEELRKKCGVEPQKSGVYL